MYRIFTPRHDYDDYTLYDAALGYHMNCNGSGIFLEALTGHTLYLLIHGTVPCVAPSWE